MHIWQGIAIGCQDLRLGGEDWERDKNNAKYMEEELKVELLID